ncbi:MAG: 50S ribosomal protein L28 [Candidatus Kapabacteria bacterium]|jgi:large subunit ribosomal protein L28|nr:50S ribosomal protein L28 [Candidatus Kapabacteria bacterium]
MARICELTGIGPLSGNNVSHANNKTKRKFLPNLQKKRIWDATTGTWITVKATARALRTVDKIGIRAMLKKA